MSVRENLTKFCVREILTRSPFSVEYFEIIPSGLQNIAVSFDKSLQKFALKYAETFDKEEWEDIQLIKLKKILNQAGNTVKYWNTTFRQIQFNHHQLKDLEEINSIPLLSREIIKKTPAELLLNTHLPRYRRIEVSTSGSTGEPLLFFQDHRAIFRKRASAFQELEYIEERATGETLVLGLSSHIWIDNTIQSFSGTDLELENTRKKIIYPYIFSSKPERLITTPSLLKRLAQLMEQDGVSFHFRVIKHVGEPLSNTDIRALEKTFNAKLYSTYGSREIPLFGIECNAKKFHLAPWMNYIEIVDPQGKLLPHDEEGRIIVTFFENYVMPFIRYDIGDRGMINSEPCPCGRKTKTITFTGRAGGSIETPSGKSVMLLAISSAIAKNFHDTIARFQLEQTAPDKLIFRFIPSARYTPAADKQLTQTLQSLLYNEIHCEFDRVPVILPNSEGKTPIFIKSF